MNKFIISLLVVNLVLGVLGLFLPTAQVSLSGTTRTAFNTTVGFNSSGTLAVEGATSLRGDTTIGGTTTTITSNALFNSTTTGLIIRGTTGSCYRLNINNASSGSGITFTTSSCS